MRRLLAVSALAAFMLAAGAATFALTQGETARAPELLPDLDQAAPENVSIRLQGESERLTFLSAVDNAGAGALVIEGRRAPTDAAMTVRQLVARADGSNAGHAVRGELRYVHSETHQHWHLLGFERYELRRPGDDRTSLRSDRKTGFCLGDRYPIPDASRLTGFWGRRVC